MAQGSVNFVLLLTKYITKCVNSNNTNLEIPMKTLLLIHTSLQGPESLSSSLASDYVAQWQANNPDGRVVSKDLATKPVPHLTAERFVAFTTAADERTAEQLAIVAFSDQLIGELQEADGILVALPMYNFGIPSTLKAYFDHVARAGITFRYTPNGPVGLLTNKRAFVFATRGGLYQGTPLDTQTDYMKTFLAFLGIEDTQFVYAEGTAMGDESLNTSVQNARQQIRSLDAIAA
ncbi:MAG: FMN-dependent NADH-azoreductase [Candidatus Azotimanducaceae bacterium]